MKNLFVCLLFFTSFLCRAQPLPKSVNATKRLFLTCNKDTILYNTDIKILEAIGLQESCFRIRDIKDSLSTKLFKIEIYQSGKYFPKKNGKKWKYF